MMRLLRATLLLFRTHFGRLLFSKRTAFCALVALGPTALAFLVLSFPDAPPAIEVVMYPAWFLLLQMVVPVLSLIAGSAVISEEIDDRTITYLFTRPVPRSALLLGRWLATALIVCLLLGLSVVFLVFTAKFRGEFEGQEFTLGTFGSLIFAAMLGGAVYTALFATLGTFLKRPMIVGLGYALVIEGFLANLPGKSQGLTILYYVRSFLASSSELWSEVHEMELDRFDTTGGSLKALMVILAVSLVLGSLVVSRRQYILTS